MKHVKQIELLVLLYISITSIRTLQEMCVVIIFFFSFYNLYIFSFQFFGNQRQLTVIVATVTVSVSVTDNRAVLIKHRKLCHCQFTNL